MHRQGAPAHAKSPVTTVAVVAVADYDEIGVGVTGYTVGDRVIVGGLGLEAIVTAERLHRERQPYLMQFVRELVERPN